MANAYTAFLNLTKPEEGADRDVWGGHWNANADAIDTWAKSINDLLPKLVRNDSSQSIAGSLAVTGNYTLATAGNAFIFGTNSPSGYITSPVAGGYTDLVPKSDHFRVVNQAYTQSILDVSTTFLNWMGNTVYHTGNLAPANYADKTSTSNQDFSSTISVKNYLDIIRTTNHTWRFTSGPDNNLYIADINTGVNTFIFGSSGSLYLNQFGDLNARIEARGAAYADDRLNSAKAYTNSYAFPVAGGWASGNITVNKGYPEIGFRRSSDGFYWGVSLRDDSGNLAFYTSYGSGSFPFQFGYGGAFYTAQFGDLNSRIENRAAAYADDRLGTATNRINNKSARLAFAGDNPINGNVNNMWEPGGGCTVTGWLAQLVASGGAYQMTLVRIRQLQMSNSNGDWYVCSYV